MTAPRVDTTYGVLEGVADGDLAVFRGVPFAAPPVGELRFAAPRAPAAWTGVRAATHFGPAAPQSADGMGAMLGIAADATSEDCLTLNVWTPALDDERRPVMVWIHGGAFVFGSGSQPMYEGAALARARDVVVVTINYRLGALGFADLGEVGADELDHTSNRGLLDQVAALQWVRDNIAAFGGDPSNVTIFGESAGGMSVCCLLGLPRAQGFFHKAISQSGSPEASTPDEGATVTRTLLSHLGLEPTEARKLLEVPIAALLGAQEATWQWFLRSRRSGLPFRPVVDGDVFPQSPLSAVAGGLAADVPVIAGTNLDEWRLFGFSDPDSFSLDDAGLATRTKGMHSDRAGLVDAYRAARASSGSTPSPSDLWFALQTDRVFRVPTLRLLEAQAAHQPNTFAYLFTWPSPLEGLGACHAVEIPLVLGNLDKPGMAMFAGDTPEAHALGDSMQAAWAAFARTGDPAQGGSTSWPAYDANRRATMVFGRDLHVEDAPLDAERMAWGDALPL